MNAIKRLSLNNFTTFREAEFEFSPGINVLIGENSTGKTHTLKALYAFLRMSELLQSKQPNDLVISDKLSSIFGVARIEQLLRHPLSFGAGDSSRLLLLLDSGERSEVTIDEWDEDNGMGPSVLVSSRTGNFPQALYLPGREILTIYPGFMSTYLKRELAYDATYFDLAVALNARPLRPDRYDEVKHLLKPLEGIFVDADKISVENERFYIDLPDTGKLEAQLLAEGLRKLATLAYLVRNGSLGPEMVLLWDEPEANLNPKLVTAVVDFLINLSQAGVQIFLATHDYLISHELSLRVEYERAKNIRFFSLHREPGEDGVLVEAGDSLADIENNPILESFVAHSDREDRLFYETAVADQPGD